MSSNRNSIHLPKGGTTSVSSTNFVHLPTAGASYIISNRNVENMVWGSSTTMRARPCLCLPHHKHKIWGRWGLGQAGLGKWVDRGLILSRPRHRRGRLGLGIEAGMLATWYIPSQRVCTSVIKYFGKRSPTLNGLKWVDRGLVLSRPRHRRQAGLGAGRRGGTTLCACHIHQCMGCVRDSTAAAAAVTGHYTPHAR